MLDLLVFYTPPMSYAVGGAIGGCLYILRQHLKDYEVRPIEYLARPVFGAFAAVTLTIGLGLPNHFTSLFAGYFGVDAWDALAAYFERALPLATPAHTPRAPDNPGPVRRLLARLPLRR